MGANLNNSFNHIIQRSCGVAKHYGFFSALSELYYRIKKRLKMNVDGEYFYLMPSNGSIPFCLRYSSSDYAVFMQVFQDLQFSCMDEVENPKLIVDCGANIGLASIYFLNQFPHAKIVALEPDESNYSLCVKNLAPYKEKVHVHKKAIWPISTGLKLYRPHGDTYGYEWAIEVREVQKGEEPDVEAMDIDSILQDEGFDCIDILKVDIEKGEKHLFKDKYQKWLPKVKNLVIELHDEECENIFFNALKDYDYQHQTIDEITICKGLQYKY